SVSAQPCGHGGMTFGRLAGTPGRNDHACQPVAKYPSSARAPLPRWPQTRTKEGRGLSHWRGVAYRTMPPGLPSDRLEAAYQTALAALPAERTPEGHWVGDLSASALSPATAVSALALVQRGTGRGDHRWLIDGGLAWLAAHQNADGGWGDTTK